MSKSETGSKLGKEDNISTLAIGHKAAQVFLMRKLRKDA
jgi:hypothetical protein